MFLEYREGGFAVTEVAVVITEGETRGELSPIGSQHNEHKLSRRGFLPFTKMNFICDLLLRNWLPTIFALEADPNVVPSSRQSGIGRCRSNLAWRQLGDWNRTSSTLVRRSRTVGLGGASVVLTCDEFKIGRLHQRQVGLASHRKVVGFKPEIPGRLNLGAEP